MAEMNRDPNFTGAAPVRRKAETMLRGLLSGMIIAAVRTRQRGRVVAAAGGGRSRMKVSIRDKRVVCREELQNLFGRGVLEDLLQSGWLKPCCEKESPTRTRKLYSMRGVEHCEARMQGGEYPQAAPVRRAKA